MNEHDENQSPDPILVPDDQRTSPIPEATPALDTEASLLEPIELPKPHKAHARKNREPRAPKPSGERKIYPTELMTAAANGEARDLARLAAAGNPNARDEWGRDALMLAAEAGHAHCVKSLLSLCDPKAVDAKGDTAFIIAARFARKDCALALFEHSNLLTKNNAGFTAWDIALVSGMVQAQNPRAHHAPSAFAAPATKPIVVRKGKAQRGASEPQDALPETQPESSGTTTQDPATGVDGEGI